MRVIRTDNIETECSRLPNGGEMICRVDLIAPHRLSRVVSCRKRGCNQVGRAEQETATLLGSRRLRVPLHCVDGVSGDLQLAAGTSITIAMPMPPPMQSDATPLPPPRFRNS